MDKINADQYTTVDTTDLQFYSGSFIKGENTMKGDIKDDFRTAFCMETQHFHSSPNQPSFPSTILKQGDVYQNITHKSQSNNYCIQ